MLKNKNKGITLVALVITIIILLILAGISISALTNTGIFAKAKDAQSKSALADAKEKMTLLLNEWQMDHVTSTKTLETFLQEKVTDKTIEEYKKLDNGNYEVYINGYVGVIDGEGNIVEEMQKAGPRPTISNITIKSEDGTTDVADNSQKVGTKLQINFSSSMENGTIKAVTPAVPYTTNGTETEVTFTVVGTVDGTDYTIKKPVSVANKYQKPFTGTTVQEAITYGSMLNSSKNTELKDVKNNKIVIPAGFKVTNDTTNVAEGIVIEDATSGATAGSQFVWVPVGKITKADGTETEIKLNRYTFASNGTPTEKNEEVIDTYFQELATSDKGNTVAKNITNFKNSVKTNGGYYIGRYEARKNKTSGKLTEVKSDKVWYDITQPDAATQARNMYDEQQPFTSDLMNSYAWDTAITFIQNCTDKTNYATQESINGSSFLSTGTTNDNPCNIFDMASNVKEWTTETSSISDRPCVDRGESNAYGYNYPSNRYCRSTSTSGSTIYFGFRPLLYVNV